MYDVAVIGGGPAGMVAAIFAAKTGAKVLLIEKNEILGRKILATGNGRCNISNTNINVSRYHGSGTVILGPVFAKFDNAVTRDFFESLGVLLKEEDRGRLFPVTNQAQTVVTALTHEIKEAGVDIRISAVVKEISTSDGHWNILLAGDKAETISVQKVILTTGGRAAHQFGSSGDGLFWARNLGLEVSNVSAALVALESGDAAAKTLSGLKMDVAIRAYSESNLMAESRGDMIFTHFGVSGPAAMSVSGNLFHDIEGEKFLEIDFMPNEPVGKIDELIKGLIERNPKKSLRNIASAFLPDRLAEHLILRSELPQSLKASELSKANRVAFISNIKKYRLAVTKPRPLKEAQVTRGGVLASELDANLQSKKLPGLFFAGEIVDIDGDSGGFNLQWAWSSGAVAGTTAGKVNK